MICPAHIVCPHGELACDQGMLHGDLKAALSRVREKAHLKELKVQGHVAGEIGYVPIGVDALLEQEDVLSGHESGQAGHLSQRQSIAPIPGNSREAAEEINHSFRRGHSQPGILCDLIPLQACAPMRFNARLGTRP
ncbi:hypothetical protein PoB_007645100 [Plakobranchus ocellatus]|uniref:Uncharacterized protein n=1 Tax=Plakobranchus ocellatus TaxID=259542 RepID=A0AAV4E1K8_9GAST|nr:hypothetical protein PoB_007645100 [Plakobranchus ocellatus]